MLKAVALVLGGTLDQTRYSVVVLVPRYLDNAGPYREPPTHTTPTIVYP